MNHMGQILKRIFPIEDTTQTVEQKACKSVPIHNHVSNHLNNPKSNFQSCEIFINGTTGKLIQDPSVESCDEGITNDN